MGKILQLDEHHPVIRRELEPILQQISADMKRMAQCINTHAIALKMVAEKAGISTEEIASAAALVNVDPRAPAQEPSRILEPN